MNAREKAAAAKLRRFSDEAFHSEAWRRGYERTEGRTWLPTRNLATRVAELDGAVFQLLDGNDVFHALRAVRRTAKELREYLKLTEELQQQREGGAK